MQLWIQTLTSQLLESNSWKKETNREPKLRSIWRFEIRFMPQTIQTFFKNDVGELVQNLMHEKGVCN